MNELEQIKCRIADLQEALETSNPGMFNFLKDIHQTLYKNPELVHLLSPEERSQVIRGLEVKVGASITTPKVKAPKPPKGGSIADFI